MINNGINVWMGEISAYCPICKKTQIFTYDISLVEIHGGDYEYGNRPGCTIEIEWICEEGFIIERKEFEL